MALTCLLSCMTPAGYNVCIFAYGQTGSGKTHTMAGTNVENLAGRGINYRALDDLFAINAQRAGEVQSCVCCSLSSWRQQRNYIFGRTKCRH